jgi:two-component system LytT family response regulator
MLRAIIVDDEAPCIETLEWDLKEYCPEVDVLATCRSGEEGLKAIEEWRPEILFLDIEMPGMNGFEMLKKVSSPQFAVIFTTAYDQYAIKAIKSSAVDYLLKPVDKDDLIQAVQKVKTRLSMVDHDQLTEDVKNKVEEVFMQYEKLTSVESVALPTSDGYEFVSVDSIVHCQSDSNYTHFYLADGSRIFISKTLKEVQHLLPESKFIRVHNSHLVNASHIRKYIRGQGGQVIMSNGQSIAVARAKKEELMNWIDPIKIQRD